VGCVELGRIELGRVELGRIELGRIAVVGELMGMTAVRRRRATRVNEKLEREKGRKVVFGGVRAYVTLVAVAAASAIAVAAIVAGTPGSSELPAMAGFAIAMFFVQLLPVPFPRGTQLELVRVEEALVVPLVLMLDPAAALMAVAAGVLLGVIAGSTREPTKVIFNTSQLVLSIAAAVAVTWAITGETSPGFGVLPLVAASTGLLAMFIVNQLLVAGVMAIASGAPLRKLLLDDVSLKGGMWVANASIGSLLVLPAIQAPALLLVALVPLAMLHGAWRVHADRAREERRLTDLGDAVGGLTGEVSLERVARALVESAREVVGASGAEVRLFDDGRAFWARRTAQGQVEFGERGEALSEREDAGSRVAFTVALGGSEGVFGELSVWHDRNPDAAPVTFSRRDRTLLEMLGHQAASVLDNSRLTARTEMQQRTIAQVFDHSSEGMLVLDRRGRVRGWNPAMQSMSGFTESTVDASPISLISPQLASIVEESEAGTLDALISTADGDHRHVRASFAPIEPDGDCENPEDHSWVVVVRDVTLEQETERLKDDFVATVSHELRTPLTAIKGFLDTMRRDDIELGAGQVRMFLQIMGEQADRLERLIGDLLDMSAIESGRPLEVDVSPVDLSSAARRAITAFEAARPQATVNLRDMDMGMVVEADPHRLEQVLTNLLDNALKHGGADTPIDVSIARTPDGAGCVLVTDHGPGISVVDQRRIFERFFVTANSVTRSGGGAGLGLYICRRLVAAMQGEIAVRSRMGEGTTFEVSLPVLATSMPGDAPATRVDRTDGAQVIEG
jgi:PAS domain S-box-containing protein